MLASKFYSVLPPYFQNMAISAYGYIWKKRRFGGIFKEEIKNFKSREAYSLDQWSEYQKESLRNLLKYANENVPFYQDKFVKFGLNNNHFRNLELKDISILPILTKDDLRKYCKSTLLAFNKNKKGAFYESSGSTGTPVSIYISYETHQKWSAAFETRIRHWAGVNYQMSRGMIGGRRIIPDADSKKPYYRYNHIEKQVYFSAYHIGPKSAKDYWRAFSAHKIDYMTGYAYSNYLLALEFKKMNLPIPQLKAVITSSEKLTAEMRVILSEVYRCKVFDSWSGVEACALISECEFGNLHISPDVGIVEILDSNGNEVNPGETGEVVCTGLLNYDQPLIRYSIGDQMTKAIDQNCKCGRNMPIIKEIVGRIEDVVIGKDGRKMVRFHSVFNGIQKINRAQVVQESRDKIILRIQNDIKLSNEDIQMLKQRVTSQLGNMEIEVKEFETIELTKNGKYKAVISNVDKT